MAGVCCRRAWQRQPPPASSPTPPRHALAAVAAAAVAATVAVLAPASPAAAAVAAAAAAAGPSGASAAAVGARPSGAVAAGNYTPAPVAAALHARLCTADGRMPPPSLAIPNLLPAADAAVTAAAASVVCDTALDRVDPCVDFFTYACGGWLDRLRAAPAAARPPMDYGGAIKRRGGIAAAAAAAVVMDLLRTVDRRGPVADAAAFVHACVDDRPEGLAGWPAAVANPAGWEAELQRPEPLAVAVPYLGARAEPVDGRRGWVAALVGLGSLDVFPVYEWRLRRDQRRGPEDYAAYIEASFPILTARDLADAGDAGARALVRTALEFAAPVLGVATDNATVGGVVGVLRRMAAIESATRDLPDVVRDEQRLETGLYSSGALSQYLLLPQVLHAYGFDLSSRVRGPVNYPVYLDDPPHLLRDLPAVGFRGGPAGTTAVPPATVRAYFVFALVVRMYQEGVLTRPVWPDGVRPSTRLFGVATPGGPPKPTPPPGVGGGIGLPPAIDECLFQMQLRGPRLHDTLDVEYQRAHAASHKEQVELLFSIKDAVGRGMRSLWLPIMSRGWFSRLTFSRLHLKLRRLLVRVGGVTEDSPQLVAFRRLVKKSGGRVLQRADDWPLAWTVAAGVTRTVAADLFRYNRVATRGDPPVHDLKAAAYEPAAYYDASLNLLFLSARTAEAPYVDAALPRSMAFGAVGAVLSHEVVHLLTGVSRESDSRGRPFNWTTPADERELTRREGCYARKYSRYTPSVFVPPADGGPPGEPPAEVAPIDGDRTVDENVADVEGLRLAWMALVQEHRRGGVDGGGVDGGRRGGDRGGGSRGNALLEAAFTKPQLFFLGRAQLLCAAYDRETLAGGQPFSRYATNEFRVQGPMSEMPAFARAWGCPAGTPYTPQQCPTMFF
ncbi:hypothetical protein I4F81_001825 [Pyropia yezoensis]|uniref:Uncharacterized protein n=1 Tax=Pyropia yezoensis TaxID=2788 RepID=A0ACC3BNP1_PYRYE|nr:hypothetical protein I4F81_001825 [Neopyropia yezoensis]